MAKKLLTLILLVTFAASYAMEQEKIGPLTYAALNKDNSLKAERAEALKDLVKYLNQHQLFVVNELLGHYSPYLGGQQMLVSVSDGTSYVENSIPDDFNALQMRWLLNLFMAYDLPRLFASNKQEGYSLLIDLLYWIPCIEQDLAKKGTAKAVSIDELKAIFEKNRKEKSLSILSADLSSHESASPAQCTLPEGVARSFPFLNAILEGKFAESQVRQFTLEQGYQQSTLSLFQRLLFIIHRFCSNPIIDPFLLNFLALYIEKEAHETELALSEELLTLAHHFDIKILIHAIVRVLETMKGKEEEIAKAIPLDYFPALTGSEHTDIFVLRLLGIKLEQLSCMNEPGKVRIPDIISDCVESITNNIETFSDSDARRWHAHCLSPYLQRKVKENLMKKFNIPNFCQVWNGHSFSHSFSESLKQWHLTHACKISPDIAAFINARNEIKCYTIRTNLGGGPWMTLAWECVRTPDAQASAIFTTSGMTAYVLPTNKIEIRSSDNKVQKIVDVNSKPADWGKITALAAWDAHELLLVSFDSGALALVDPLTAQYVRTLEEPCLQDSKEKPFACKFSGNIEGACCAFTDGTIKIYCPCGFFRTFKIPQLMNQKGLITACQMTPEGVLIICTKKGSVYCVDWRLGKIIRILDVKRNNVAAMTCSQLWDRYIAIGYSDGGVLIWDIVEGVVVKYIPSKKALPLCLTFVVDHLEVIYSNWIVEEHYIPEIASLASIMKRLQKV